MSSDPVRRLRKHVVEITSLLVTGLWLGLFFTGFWDNLWIVALIVGYVVVVPLSAILFGDEEDVAEWWNDVPATAEVTKTETEGERRTGVDEDTPEPLEALRERYAAGELTDGQFERKLEAVLEAETIEDVDSRHGDRDTDRDTDRDDAHDSAFDR